MYEDIQLVPAALGSISLLLASSQLPKPKNALAAGFHCPLCHRAPALITTLSLSCQHSNTPLPTFSAPLCTRHLLAPPSFRSPHFRASTAAAHRSASLRMPSLLVCIVVLCALFSASLPLVRAQALISLTSSLSSQQSPITPPFDSLIHNYEQIVASAAETLVVVTTLNQTAKAGNAKTWASWNSGEEIQLASTSSSPPFPLGQSTALRGVVQLHALSRDVL